MRNYLKKMKPIQNWFDEYAESHQNQTNKLIHWFCVPLIFFSIIGLLASIPADWLRSLVTPYWQPYLHYGTLLTALGLLFYFRLSLPMAIGILLFSIVCLQVVVWLKQLSTPLWFISILIFALAWVGQFIGHKIEGKKPSFLQDLQFLMIGPAWLMSFIYRRLHIRY